MRRLRGITWSMRRGHAPLVAASAAFARTHPGVEIEWEALPWHAMRLSQRRELAAASGRYDLIMLDQPWVGDYADNGWIVALDELASADERAALARAADPASLAAYRHAERQWALPVDAACQTLTYRPDLLGGAPPDDWDGLLALLRERHAPPGSYGCVHALADSAGALLFVLSVAAAAGHEPYREPGGRFDPEVGVPALELLSELKALALPPEQLAGRRQFELMRDRDAVALWPAAFPYSERYVEGERPPLAFADMPRLAATGRRTSGLGGVGLGIARASRERELAWEFAAFAMSEQVQGGCWIDEGGQPGHLGALRGAAMAARDGELGRRLADALDGCWLRPHWAGWSWVEVHAAGVLAELDAGRTDPREALRALDALVANAPAFAAVVDLSEGGGG